MASRSHSPSVVSGTQETSSPDKWAAARARSRQINQLSSPSKINSPQSTPKSTSSTSTSRKPGLFRKLSESLPQWQPHPTATSRSSRMSFRNPMTSILHALHMIRINRSLSTLLSILFLLVTLLLYIPTTHWYRRSLLFGSGARYVIILASNQGGGVMEWKGPREWAIERDSIKNKKQYTQKWGYDLDIVDMATKKKYAHEWRESWEKVDHLRRCMFEYPQAEWFWWLDLNTFIMEPEKTLQEHVFGEIEKLERAEKRRRNIKGGVPEIARSKKEEVFGIYRDINQYNPLNITHPPKEEWLDEQSRSVDGDGKTPSINMLIPQDCSGFNLGSFFVRRSEWTNRVLDIWWDPVHYEQRHMEWEHKEQDAFEHLYANQPWIRSGVGFIKQRLVNSFPDGACGENDTNIHYREKDRDFVVNMAGCEWGRDCWGEMFRFRELSRKLNRTWWQKLKAWVMVDDKEHAAPQP